MSCSPRLPVPSSVRVTSDQTNPLAMWPIGSVTLTCTVELSPSVDVPVTVNTAWTGPAGFWLLAMHGQLCETLPPTPEKSWSAHFGEINLEITPVQPLSAQCLHSLLRVHEDQIQLTSPLVSMKPTSTSTSLSLFKAPIDALGQLLMWLDHLVLYCTDKAQLGRNSCLQFALY